MTNIPIIKVPGKPFQQQVERLREAFKAVLATPYASFPIEKIFHFIQLAESNAHVQRKLVNRGSFKPDTKGIYHNTGGAINERIQDIGPNLAGLQLYIGRDIAIKASVAGDDLVLVPVNNSRILVTFDEPPLPGMPTTFFLERILGQLAAWRYLFQDEINPDTKVEIVVDMTLQAQVFAGRSSNLRSLTKPVLLLRETRTEGLAFQECECVCCTGFKVARPKCPKAEDRLTFDLHGRIVVANAADFPGLQATYRTYVAATQGIFAIWGINLVDRGAQAIIDPTLVALDATPCVAGVASADIAALFRQHYPQAIGPNAVVAFLVQTLAGSTLGCASHPEGQPGLTMEWVNDNFTLSHELGHVFGLVHVPNSENLMNPTSPYTNPPPELDNGQIVELRCSHIMNNLGRLMVASENLISGPSVEPKALEEVEPGTPPPPFVREFEAIEPQLARLATYGGKALPYLEHYFFGDHESLAARAVRVAALLENGLGCSLLERAVGDRRMAVRAALAAALREGSVRGSEALVARLLEDPEPAIRRFAIEAARSLGLTALAPALERIRDSDSIPALRELAGRIRARISEPSSP